MRKIFVFNMTSLDGYFSGQNGELDWHTVDAEFNEFALEQLKEVDALLFGRVTYEMMARYWPTEIAKKREPVVAKRMNSLPKFVVSQTLERTTWENATFIKTDVIEEIAKLKERPGNDIAIFGSSILCVSLLQANLIDECRIMVNPVILGKGRSLFAGIRHQLPLKLLSTRTFNSGNTLLSYKPTK